MLIKTIRTKNELNELTTKIKALASQVERIDIIFDVYRAVTIKRETRESRGSGARVSIRRETPIMKSLRGAKSYLQNDNNKVQLFTMFADIIIESCQDILSHIISTKSEGAVNNKNLPLNAIQPCTQEEADTRIFLHVNDIANLGHRRITIITVDTDVGVIALYIFFAIDVDELWIEFCTGKNKRWLPIHLYANALGEECC